MCNGVKNEWVIAGLTTRWFCIHLVRPALSRSRMTRGSCTSCSGCCTDLGHLLASTSGCPECTSCLVHCVDQSCLERHSKLVSHSGLRNIETFCQYQVTLYFCNFFIIKWKISKVLLNEQLKFNISPLFRWAIDYISKHSF